MNQTLEKEIKTASASRLSGPLTSPVSTLTPSEVVDEYLDHEKRKSNLIVYNLDETNRVQTASERSKSDMSTLLSCFILNFMKIMLKSISASV